MKILQKIEERTVKDIDTFVPLTIKFSWLALQQNILDLIFWFKDVIMTFSCFLLNTEVYGEGLLRGG